MVRLLLVLPLIVAGAIAYPHTIEHPAKSVQNPVRSASVQNPDPFPVGCNVLLIHFAAIASPNDLSTDRRDDSPSVRVEVDVLLGVNKPGGTEVDPAQCSDVIVVFARGTTENGTIGARVGPQLQNALFGRLTALGKSMTFVGVPYSASIPGFLEGGDPSGSREMALQLTAAARSCPNAALVSVGYSQGAQLVHNSACDLPADVAPRLTAVVTFGDPDTRESVQGIPASKLLAICRPGDGVCDVGEGIVFLQALLLLLWSLPHLSYYQNVDEAANFIVGKI
ncbi:cutinase-domain-containing protein [Mycena filopes]|nr:cutinase-domain-containing protein [Mycena filopes]